MDELTKQQIISSGEFNGDWKETAKPTNLHAVHAAIRFRDDKQSADWLNDNTIPIDICEICAVDHSHFIRLKIFKDTNLWYVIRDRLYFLIVPYKPRATLEEVPSILRTLNNQEDIGRFKNKFYCRLAHFLMKCNKQPNELPRWISLS